MRGIIIAGTHSGCGKTTITLGLLAALKKKGLKLQSFKAGPDFIDSGLHKLITGRPSRNLDVWMCGRKYVKDCFKKYSAAADIAVVEGVMGMYDGEYSTARLAVMLNLPVILVIDAYGMAESAGAVVKGFRDWGLGISKKTKPQHLIPNPYMAGVIFNRVASERHYERLKNSVHDVEVLGYLPRDLDFEIPHRHLGLTVAEENPITKDNIDKLADTVLRHMEMDRIIDGSLSCCHSHESGNPDFKDKAILLSRGKHLDSCLRRNDKTHLPIHREGDCPRFTGAAVESGLSPATARIAVAYDKAFCFYYEDNLDMLKNAGAEIITFSPLADKKIPDVADAVYIGGGYPELYAKELSGNTAMLKSIKKWSDAGRPLYAECGGLMYLSHGIYDFEENFLTMASVFPFETQMRKEKSHLGYREIFLKNDCIIGKKGDRLRGHEFHYSEIKPSEGTVPDLRMPTGIVESGLSPLSPSAGEIYSVRDNHGEFINSSGYSYKNTLASYIHIHFGSNLNAAKKFVRFIQGCHSRAKRESSFLQKSMDSRSTHCGND